MLSIIKLRLLGLRDDFAVIVLMTVMALGFTAIFGISFDHFRPTVLVVDEDKSGYSEALINELKDDKGLNFEAMDMKDAAAKVEEGKAIAALVIPKGFDEGIKSGDSASLGVLKIKDDILIFTMQEVVSGIVLKMAGGERIADITADFIYTLKPEAGQAVKVSAYQSVMEAWEYKRPLEVISAVAGTGADSSYDNLKHSMIGFSLYFSMYTMVFGIGTILNDRQYKTWQRMLITPVSRASILGGNMATAYFIGAIQIGILILGGKYLLGIDWGSSISGVLTVAGSFVFAVTSMGLMLSGVVKTHAQLSAVTPVVLTSTSMLGGCMWPLDIVNNKVLLLLAELTPQKWAMQGMESIVSKGMGFEAAVYPAIVLMAMGVLFFAVGVKVMRFE
ncbi:MAG TPA: ABC transporter permease [Bacillota bacterium]|jgi:ABC-2 type transport system permease protein|nr:ABC transporter permease [Bacillota bacterium]